MLLARFLLSFVRFLLSVLLTSGESVALILILVQEFPSPLPQKKRKQIFSMEHYTGAKLNGILVIPISICWVLCKFKCNPVSTGFMLEFYILFDHLLHLISTQNVKI